MSQFYRFYGKRIFDLLIAIPTLILFLPLYLIVAILIRFDSRGPIFFIQERLGRDGSIFDAFKFRTMTDRPREAVPGGEVFGRDREVTKLGYYLRRFKIDELPQLWNILRGEMSVVGPRPALPRQLEEYDELAMQRLQLRPGLTGLAQINGNIHLSWPERWRFDVDYVENLSFKHDLQIIFFTVAVIIFGEDYFLARKTENTEKDGQ
mgnify:CR=1 FL=1